jgi:ubiquinone/menaquinone biosynthesis C-methylase UbiE
VQAHRSARIIFTARNQQRKSRTIGKAMNETTGTTAVNNNTDFESAAKIHQALAPSDQDIRRMPLNSNKTIAGELLAEDGTRALDVGCGDGKFTRVLATIFPTVNGIDVNERKVAEAQKAAEAAGLTIRFRAGSAEAMPYPDDSLDVVAFSNSLHHVADMDRALREAARVLVPNGLLYIMEPVPAGNYHDATKLVSDETAVRTEAYRAIGRALRHGFSPVTEVMYRARREFSNFEEWRDEQIERGESRRLILESRGDEARKLFEGNAERADGCLAFDQVFRVNLLRKVRIPA